MASRHQNNGRNERGGVFLLIFVAIALLAALTWAVSQSTEQQTSLPTTAQQDNQISVLISQASVLQGALQQMVANGADPAQLYSTDPAAGLNTVTPGGTPPLGFAAWDVAPHNYKIYHPYGGGVKYVTQTGAGAALSDTNNVANNFKISKGSIVTGVGPTDTNGDILFTAAVSSLAACQSINVKVRGTAANATPPTMLDATYTALITNGTDTTLDLTTCANCVNIAASCVRNTSTNAWGYYQSLLPQ